MRGFAENTTVSVETTRMEIERTLERYGADKFGYARDDSRGLAVIHFSAQQRAIRFVLALPKRDEQRFWKVRGRRRNDVGAAKAWEQACRQRWRALHLCIKAKLEAVQSGIAQFEDEFMANIVLPNGATVSELLRPQLAKAYLSGEPPPGIAGMLPAPTKKGEDGGEGDG
jgi:hypothetical protein